MAHFISDEIMAELRALDGQQIPTPEVRQRAGLDSLPDGNYDFEIRSGELKRIDNGSILFEFQVKILGGAHDGFCCGLGALWIKNQDGTFDTEKIGRLMADFVTLGFDADQWTGSRTFSKEVGKVIARLPGIKAKGKKVSKPGKTRTFHNLYINARLPDDHKPAPAPEKPIFATTEDAAAANGGKIPW